MKRKKFRGFTLVELMIALALSVLVGGTLYLLQSTGMSQVSKGTTRLIIQSDMRIKMEKLVADLRCAEEVLEISPNSIKIGMHKTVGDEGSSGKIDYFTVKYELEKIKDKFTILRSENQEAPKEIFSAGLIEHDIFCPFYETPPDEGEENPTFDRFDMSVNDSDQRKRITFIRIRMKVRQNKEHAILATAVTLRPAHQLLKQPNWKFR